MNEPVEDAKIIGIPKGKYLKATYILLLVSSVSGVLKSLLGLFGGMLPFSSVLAVCGFAGLVMVLLGFFVFKNKFSFVENTHFKYMGSLFLLFMMMAVVLALLFGKMGGLLMIFAVLLNIFAVLTIYAGFRLFGRGVEATMDNVINEIKSLQSGINKS